MKTYTIYEIGNLKKFDDTLFYFLQGDDGFYRRKKLGIGSYNHCISTDADFFVVSKAIQEAGCDELTLLLEHVKSRLKASNDELERSKKAVMEHEGNIHKYEQLKNMIPNYKTFREAFEYISI